MSKLVRAALLFAVAVLPAAAQSWDSSGNSKLNGTYYFREVIYALGDQYGDLGEAVALYGTLVFNGSGSYTANLTLNDTSSGAQSGSVSGTYTISASGYGYITVPLLVSGGYKVWGSVSAQGIFVGSAQLNANDLFIAAPLASPTPTNASFRGTYTVYGFDPVPFSAGSQAGSPAYFANYQMQLNPDGAGNLGNVTINGYFGGGGSKIFSQTSTGLKYSFSNGGCNLGFPNSNSATFIYGQRFLYISADGNFVFGGSPASWDMFIGVKNGSPGTNLSGLYYQAGLDVDGSQLANGYAPLDTYYGSFTASGGATIEHQQTLNPLILTTPYANTFSQTFSIKSDGTYNNGFLQYMVAANGAVRIGTGIGPSLGLNVAVAAPALNPTGSVYLSPTGVVNAASNAPFTTGIAPGELITLYGSGLASGLQIASSIPFPSTLGDVQVNIGGLPAPIYYVSPTQISVIVPYAVTGTLTQIQVISNSTSSNTVTTLVNKTAPGIFTQNQSGIGYGAVIHLDGTLVTPSHPAQINETVSVFLTGLGVVNPLVPDGSAGPVTPLSNTTNTITVDVSGISATVGYTGLAPQLAGLYQINFTIPTGVSNGDNFLDILGPDSYAAQALIPVGSGTTAEIKPHRNSPPKNSNPR